MAYMILSLIVLSTVILLYAVGLKFWPRTLPFSYSQGANEMFGRVAVVARLPGKLVEVTLICDCAIDPRLQKGPAVMTSCQIGSFVHFRPLAKLPNVGDVIITQTTNRLYPFLSRSLNWVDHWSITDRPPLQGRVVPC